VEPTPSVDYISVMIDGQVYLSFVSTYDNKRHEELIVA